VNCHECVEKLETYVDRELSETDVENMKRHLADCPPCEDQYQFEAGLRRLVRVCCGQGEAPPELRAKLREILY
jgi:mycothiol system anti-sigma-R factor